MDFRFYNQPTTKQKVLLKLFAPLNKLFAKLKWHIEMTTKAVDEEMITVEQRINLFHLINETLLNEVAGDFIELGCWKGYSAMQIQAMLYQAKSDKKFHVYDSFNVTSDPAKNFKNIFIKNFKNANLNLPVMHEGFFNETLPSQLPEKLAFIHLDCSIGQDQIKLIETIIYCLEHVYPRMTPKAVCLIMDYHDVDKTIKGKNTHPGIKTACDMFFEDKPEKMNVLYGNHFSHGYFRKEK